VGLLRGVLWLLLLIRCVYGVGGAGGVGEGRGSVGGRSPGHHNGKKGGVGGWVAGGRGRGGV
jgi:MFS family permease